MYIWRGKNRRDRRNLLLLGDNAWTSNHDDHNYEEEDEKLRYEKELQHIEYFSKRVRQLMEEYLDTAEGNFEINLLRKELELERRAQERLIDSEENRINDAETMRKNVMEIFRRYAIPGSETLTVSNSILTQQ